MTYVITAKGNEYECDCEAGALGFPYWHKAAVLAAKTERMSGARVIGPAPHSHNSHNSQNPTADAKVRETPRRQALV